MKSRWMAVILFACSVVVLADRYPVEASSIGDRVGEVVSTDIIAYVNGKQIPSMNIAGETVIAAEDLRQSGFDVAWSPRARTLRIAPKTAWEPGAVDPALPRQDLSALPIGSHLEDVLYTDIQAYYGDKPLRSFNIDGRTVIVLNDLDAFGTVNWNEAERTIRFQAKTPSAEETRDTWREAGADILLRNVKDVSFDLDFREEGQFYKEQQVGFGEDGLPFMKLDFFADKFGYATSQDADSSDIRISDGLYSFSIQPGSKQAVTYWGGQVMHSYEMVFPSRIINGELNLYSIDLERLFGYIGKWDQDARNLSIRYTSYDVEDYGLPIQEGSDKLTVKAIVEMPWDYWSSRGLALKLDNDRIFGNLVSAMQKTGDKGENVSWMEAPLRLHLGENSISTQLVQGDRILYASSSPVRTSYTSVPLTIGIPGFHLNQTETGYIKTDASNLMFTGKADTRFSFAVWKFEEGHGYVSITSQVPVEATDGTFQMPITLNKGNGLYQVQLYTQVATPRGPGYSSEGYFYVMLLQP